MTLSRAALVLLWFAAFVASPAVFAQAAPESRLALVIGNGSYKQSPLPNAVADAKLMQSVLRESGFEIIKAENATVREMRRLVRDFGDRLKRSGGVGLFYYAGHGVQVRGENYLVSIDSDIRNEDEVADDSISAQLVLEKMESAGNRTNLIILDACRNNPFSAKSRAAGGGLAVMNAPSGTLVAYSTAPGAVAADGTGANSLYTKHLANTMRQPGLPVEEVFKLVRTAVRRDSKNQQTPWENTALEGQFFFRPAAATKPVASPPKPPPATVAPAPDSSAFELAFWDSIRNSNQRADFEEYLKQFPDGRFAGLARNRIASLDKVAPPPPPSAPVAKAPVVQSPPAVTEPLERQAALSSPAKAAAVAATAFVSLGDRLVFKDFDPISGAATSERSRLITRLTDTELELDGGALTISHAQASSDIARRVSGPEVLGAGYRLGADAGKWPGEFLPGVPGSPRVPLEFQFERMESGRIADKPVELARIAVRGYASRNGVLGIVGSAGGMIRGHVLVERRTGLVVEMQLTCPHPHYALRRELVSVVQARR